MRKTGIDFEKIDSNYRELKSITKDVCGYTVSCNASFIKVLLALAKIGALRFLTIPARMYHENKEFKAFKTKCRTDEKKRFESLRRTGRI